MTLSAIALSVFRESVRDRVFYNLLLFAVLLVAASFLIGQLTAGQDLKIIKDLGLAATSLFGLFISVSTLWIPVELKNVGALGILILILLVRPQGILGRAQRVG
jgi:branched-subunit amino acid ABC-type transport system permease component